MEVRVFRIFILFLALFAGFSSLAMSAPSVWIAPGLHRVGLNDASNGVTQATLYGAKGAYDSFQIVVPGGSSGLSNVNVSISSLQGPGVIPSSSLNLYRELYVNVTSGSPNWGGSNQPLGSGWYADPLIPFTNPANGQSLSGSGATYVAAPFSATAGQNVPIWVDLLIPANAVAGQYAGSYTVTSDQGSVTGPISVTVWNFSMPLSPYLKSSFLFWTAGNTASIEELLRHRLTPASAATSDESTLMGSFGMNTTDVGYYSGASAGDCSMSPAPSVSQFQSAASAQPPGLMLYDYSADEITACANLYPTLTQWAQNMHQAGIENLVTMAPTPALFNDGTGTGRSVVDIWVMLPVEYNGDTSNIATALNKGDAAWSYNTLVQDAYSPKWEIDFAPVNFRLQPGFISQSLGLTGLLYWRVDDFTSSPWTNPNNAGTFSANNYPGEGMLVYPGAQVGLNQVVPSMRLKWLRDGVEDYDYVQILKKAGNSTLAMQIANSVAADWTNWSRDENAVMQARIEIGQAINQLVGGSNTSSAPATPSGPATPSAPSAVSNPSPALGTSGVALTVGLSWSAATGATSYDVYFGTAAQPAYVTTTSGTTYNPATLSNGTSYFWQVVAKNSGGSTASPVWAFSTVNSAPSPAPVSSVAVTAGSVSPSPWTGTGHNFTLTYSDSSGYQNLTGGSAMINSTFNGVNSCWWYFDQGSNQILLASDNTSAWTPIAVSPWGVSPSASVSNSQCTIWGAWAQGSGTSLNVVVSVSFSNSFAGQKTVWLYAADKSGLSSGYQAKGSWDIQ